MALRINGQSDQIPLHIFNINCWVYSSQLRCLVTPWMKIRGEDVPSDEKYKCSPRMTHKGGPNNFCI